MSFKLVQARVDLAIVELLRALSYRAEHQWFRIDLWVDTQNVEYNARCGSVVSASYNVAVADDEQ